MAHFERANLHPEERPRVEVGLTEDLLPVLTVLYPAGFMYPAERAGLRFMAFTAGADSSAAFAHEIVNARGYALALRDIYSELVGNGTWTKEQAQELVARLGHLRVD